MLLEETLLSGIVEEAAQSLLALGLALCLSHPGRFAYLQAPHLVAGIEPRGHLTHGLDALLDGGIDLAEVAADAVGIIGCGEREHVVVVGPYE